MKLSVVAVLLALGLASAATVCPRYTVSLTRHTSSNRKGLVRVFEKFRKILGAPNNQNEPGPLKRGHRQINWDADVVPFKMPADFFQLRGAIFIAKNGKFAVSNPPDGSDDRFNSIMRFKNQFITFSPKRLFTPVLQNKITTRFTIPGSFKRAHVAGFGAVFVDVRARGKTTMTLLDRNGCRITTVIVPTKPGGLSFVGVKVAPIKVKVGKKIVLIKNPVAKVVKTLGTEPIISKRKGDFVVLDDLLYSEPQRVM